MADDKGPVEDLFNEDEESNIDFSIFDDQIKLKEMNDKHGFIKDYFGKPMVYSYVYSDVHKKDTLRFITPEAFATIYQNKYIEIAHGKTIKLIELGRWWLKHGKRNEYQTVIFDPQQQREFNNCYNLWEGYNCEPKKGSWKYMRKHIWEILCNKDKEKFKYIIKWLAWAIQNPHERAETAIVFKGKEGAGKGVVLSQFVDIFGPHAVQIGSREQLTGKFTGHLRLVVFIYADEAYYPGDKEVEGTLKNLITEDKVMREAKFSSPSLEKNRLHIAMSTNNEWVIPAGLDSRRFFINEVSNKYAKNEISDYERDVYFNRLWQEMKSNGKEAMLFDLLKINVDGWHPRKNVPITEELKKQQRMGIAKADKAIKYLIELGEFPGEFISTGEYEIRSGEFYETIDKIYPDGKRASMNAKWDVLKKLGVAKKRTNKGVVMSFPSLKIMRDKWDIHYPKEDWDLTEEWIVRKSEY